MPQGIVAITGHRIYPDRASLYRGLDTLRAKEYFLGGARGVDSDALEYLAKTQPHSVRTVVVPNRLVDQPKATIGITRKNASRIVELKNSGAGRYMTRNRYLVDHSDRTAAFYDFRGKGGTHNTIKYAQTKGKMGQVFPMRDFNRKEFTSMSRKSFGNWMKQMKNLKVNLSSIKMIILDVILNIFHTTIPAFFGAIGQAGVRSIEQYFKL